MMDTEPSTLSVTGFTYTSEIGYRWCEYHIQKVREQYDPEKAINALLWSYRLGPTEVISLELSQEKPFYSIELLAGGEFDDDVTSDEFTVPDLVEALHLIGIVKASLTLDIEVGRRSNETNQKLLEQPLKPNQTNGYLRPI